MAAAECNALIQYAILVSVLRPERGTDLVERVVLICLLLSLIGRQAATVYEGAVTVTGVG